MPDSGINGKCIKCGFPSYTGLFEVRCTNTECEDFDFNTAIEYNDELWLEERPELPLELEAFDDMDTDPGVGPFVKQLSFDYEDYPED